MHMTCAEGDLVLICLSSCTLAVHKQTAESSSSLGRYVIWVARKRISNDCSLACNNTIDRSGIQVKTEKKTKKT